MNKLATIIICLFFNTNAMGEYNAAITIKTVHSKARNAPIEVYYWYPTQQKTTDYTFGNAKIFSGVETALNATIASGQFPIVLLAHGGMRSSFTHTGWIASSLAEKGFIVAVPKPPNPQNLQPNVAINELWLRPTDLSLSLSTLEKDTFFNNSISKDNISGIGFFLGGTSMLSLSGLKINASKYKASCHTNQINIDCDWLASNKVDLNNLSGSLLSAIKKENRITSLIVINPELTKVFQHDSFEAVSIPIKVINLIEKNNHPLSPAISLQKIPMLKSVNLKRMTAYSAFDTCTQIGKKILSSEGEGDVCDEPNEVSRQKSHQRIMEEIMIGLNTK